MQVVHPYPTRLKLLQVRREAGAVVVVGDHLRAGRERRFDPRLAGQPLLDGLLGQQRRADHHRGVGRVGARRDRGDHDRAVVDHALLAVGEGHLDRVRGPTFRVVGRGRNRRDGVVLAGRGRIGGREALVPRFVDAVLDGLDVGVQRLPEHRLGRPQRDAVLGPLRAGQRRLDRGQVEFESLRVRRLDRLVVPEVVLLGVRLDQGDVPVLAAGEAQVAQRLLVDREDRAGRAVLGAHVADRRAVGQRHRGDAGPVELDELPDDTVLAQHLGDGEDEVGRGGAVGQLTGQLEPDDAGDEHRDRLAEHRGLGLDAADAPAEHAEAVDHRGVRVGADEGVRVGQAVAREHDAGEVLDVDLVHDPGAGRHDLELVEGGLAPAQELVALDVALVLEFDVALERIRRAEQVGDHGVVDDELGRSERVDLRCVAAQLGHRLAHRREVDDRRNAGEVLHDDARRGELDLGVRFGLGVPGGERLDLFPGDHRPVLAAEQVLQQHLEAERQPVGALDGGEPVDLVLGPAGLQRALRTEAVRWGGRLLCRHCRVLLRWWARPLVR
jgi:hypothetical protein